MGKLTVMDLFCGAGGISEGFREMGFKVVWVLDNWDSALETHLKNHPDTETVKDGIENIDPATLPKVDVLVGGPPCTEFSYAKKGGGGNLAEGMRLVTHFLHFVDVLKPKYWIMENVPRLLQTLPREVDLSDFGFKDSGILTIPRRTILNAADYGAPQKRLRLISGKYPLPKQTHFETIGRIDGAKKWVPMRKVVEGLPNLLSRPKKCTMVQDPLYDFLELESGRLSGHFINTVMTDDEARENRKSKVDHSWYGKMKFPDDLDRPARTVMATQFRASRETMAIEVKASGKIMYRTPTIRECASFQGFPITYQFWGKDFSTRIKLVGNAVPVNLSSALARAILEAEGQPIPRKTLINKEFEMPPEVEPRRGINKKSMLNKKFRDHIPGSKSNGFRVDFDNMGDEPKLHPMFGKPHVREWVARLYVGSGDTFKSQAISMEDVLKELKLFANTPENRDIFQGFISELANELPSRLPDATTLQAIRARWVNGIEYTPYWITEKIGEIVDRHFPESEWKGVRISPSGHIQIIHKSGLTVRAAATLLAAAYVSDVINKGDEWLFHNPDKFFVPDDWSEKKFELKKPKFDSKKYMLNAFDRVSGSK